jgi:hypothetical protein
MKHLHPTDRLTSVQSAISASVVSSQQQTCHRGGMLQAESRHSGRVEDASLEHIAVEAGARIEALVLVVALYELADRD